MKKYLLAIAVAISSMIFVGCSKENKEDKIPVPPKAATLAVDFSTFETSTTKAGSEANGSEFYNFVAGQVMSGWVSIFNNTINIPLEAYKKLLISAVPVESGNGYTWTVEYTDALNQKYTVVLYGEEAEDKVNWEIRVSKDGVLGYEDFTWVTGWSTKDGKEGQWSVKVNPLTTDVLVTLDWTADETKVKTVKITYALNKIFGDLTQILADSYLIYSASATDPAYNNSIVAYYNHMNIIFWQVNIEWNSDNGSGRVSCQGKYGDLNWYTWEALYNNNQE